MNHDELHDLLKTMDPNVRRVYRNTEGKVICPRCKRVAQGWPLQRSDKCSPKDWASCIRNL